MLLSCHSVSATSLTSVLESGKEGDEDVISGFFKFSLPCLRVILHTGQPVDSDILLGITPGRVRNTKLMD